MKLELPDERRNRSPNGVLICFGVLVIPALILALWFRPFTQDHIGLILAAMISGGFLYWSGANLLSGVYRSRQGVYKRAEAPIRYWINTLVVAVATMGAIYFLIHQVVLVVTPNLPNN